MHGFNGIWLRGAMRKFAKCSVFPEFGEDADRILGELRRLCRRAARLGMKVFLYMNEPMGLDDDDLFWDEHPGVRGTACHFKPVSYLCSSTPEVKRYLRESCEYVFTQVPELAGVVLITASEYPSHCYCHTKRPGSAEQLEDMIEGGKVCPRCGPRTPQEVVGEIITLIRDGVKAANPDAEVIAWNWSWNMYEDDPQRGFDHWVVFRGQVHQPKGRSYRTVRQSSIPGGSPRRRGFQEALADRHAGPPQHYFDRLRHAVSGRRTK